MAPLERALRTALLALVLVGVLAACSDDGGDSGGGEGARLFKVHCATCHGGSGGGGLGPDLHGIAERISIEAHIETVTEGRAGGMPSFQGDLTPTEIQAVVEYERSEFK